MSRYSITLDENRFGYLLDLFIGLGIPFHKEKEIEEYIPRNKEQLKSDLREAISEAKMAAEGKIQLQTWDEFKRELSHEL